MKANLINVDFGSQTPTLAESMGEMPRTCDALPAEELRWLEQHFGQDLPATDVDAELEYLAWVDRCQREAAESDPVFGYAA